MHINSNLKCISTVIYIAQAIVSTHISLYLLHRITGLLVESMKMMSIEIII